MSFEGEECARCKEIGQDRRTLWMACSYEMGELGIPLKEMGVVGRPIEIIGGGEIKESPGLTFTEWTKPDESKKPRQYSFYQMRACKDCRGDWLQAIKRWFNTCPKQDEWECSYEKNIPVRVMGRTVMMDDQEYHDYIALQDKQDVSKKDR